MALNSPFELFMRARELKDKRAQQDLEAMQQAGQTLGSTLQGFGQQHQQTLLQQKLAQMMGQMNAPAQPQQGPQLPGMGMGRAAQAPQSGMGAPPLPFNGVDQGQLMQTMGQLYPDALSRFMTQKFDPLKQSEIAKNNAITARYNQMANPGGGLPPGKTNLWVDPASGKVSATEKPGWTKRLVSDAEALQYTGVSKSAGFKADQTKTKSLDADWKEVRKMVNPFRSTGIGGASSVFNKAAVANQAAARGLKILLKPTLTWAELNAYVNSDIASIQRGGTPTDIQLHEANYNTLLGKVGAMKTFMSGKPAKGLVPPETVQQIKQNILDIINVDNQIIDDGIGYVEQAYPESIAAHQGTWGLMKNAAMKIKTVGQSGTPTLGGQSDDPLGIMK